MRYQVQVTYDAEVFDDIGQPEDNIANACAIIERCATGDLRDSAPNDDASQLYRIVVVA